MTRSSVVAVILANLACSPLFGCKPDEPVRTPEPEGKSMPVATDRPTPETAQTTTPPPPDPGSCMTDKDCGPGLRCAMKTDGAHLLPPPGFCHDGRPMPGGRPLLVDDVAHVARTTQLEAPSALGAQLRDDALAEHASVAAFARTICQLMSLGAPSWLLERTQRALADEIEHARDTFAFAARLGVVVMPGDLPEAVAPFPGAGDENGVAASLLRDVFRGGCIGETLAAHDVAARALSAPLDDLRTLYGKIADDEARHAALAYETALWIVRTFPEQRAVLEHEKARFFSSATDGERALLEPLLAVLT
jgi:hypothetical protein